MVDIHHLMMYNISHYYTRKENYYEKKTWCVCNVGNVCDNR